MSKLDQIQNALKAIDQANFQKLCDSYFHRTLDIKAISSVGSVAGSAKTRTGQPDTLITLNNGKYIFVEATTEQSGLLKKFSDDLDECFDEDKTGVQLTEVEKIFLACNRKLSQKDKTVLIKKGQDKGCIVDFLDLDSLSFDLYQKFQPLAKEFLGIELDTGQILTPVDFIAEYQKSKFATPLDNKFYFREKEKEQIIESINSNDLSIIYGKAGVGKSKLALECAKEFIESNSNFQTFCITSKNLDLYENLKAYFGADGNYLIIVDDANRLLQLQHILYLLHEQTPTRKIKIILTVRDYAINQIRHEARNYFPTEIELQKFSNDEMTKILEDGFGIKNHDYIYRINRISDGNSRLAIMAAKIALETNRLDSINDVSNLYDEYFVSINNDLAELGNTDLIKVAGVISFFKTLDRTNLELFEKIAQAFNFTPNEFWTNLEKLHDLEIVDLDYEVAKISDQILGTYIFYKAFLKDKVLDFSILLNEFSDKFSYRMVDTLNPIIRDFDNKLVYERLQPHVNKRWEQIKDNEENLLSFIKLFHYLKQTETLLFLKTKFDSFEKIKIEESEIIFPPNNNIQITDKYLEILRLLEGENIETVFDLTFCYLEKNLQLLPQVIHLLTDDFCFDHYSHYWNYFIQEKVVQKLISKSKDENTKLYKKVFLQVAGKYLQMKFSSNSSSGLSVTIHNFQLRPCESINEIRKSLWQRLIEIYQTEDFNQDIYKIIINYSQAWHEDYVVKEIVEKDAEILIPFISSLNTEDYQVCVLANEYFYFLKKVGVDFDKSIISRFTNKTYEISQVLSREDRRYFELGYEDYQKYKKELLESYFSSYKFEDYTDLFERCQEIQSYQEEKRDYYQLHYPLINALVNLSDSNEELYFKVINHLMESGNKLYLEGNHLIYKLVEKSENYIEVYKNINKFEFNRKTNWLFSFFQSLDKNSTNQYYLDELYNFYKTANLNEIPQRFEYLENYLHIDNDVYIKSINSIFDRVKNAEGYFDFGLIFNSHTDTFNKLEEIFANDIPLLKEIYLHQEKIDRHNDYDNKALNKIYNLDNLFIYEYLDNLYSEENSRDVFHNGRNNYSFIWDDENAVELFRSLLEFTIKKEDEKQYFWGPSYIEIFLQNLSDAQKEKATNLLKELLRENAPDKNKASHIFQIVVNCFGDKKKEFLEAFLEVNKNFEDFKWLSFETNHIVIDDVGSTSRYEHKIKFYESLFPLFNSLEFLEHKLAIKESITNYKQYIEREKRRTFIGHY
jgi:PhoH-like protein